MDRAEKKELVATLSEVFKTTNVVVVAHYSGLSVAQMQTLRKRRGIALLPDRTYSVVFETAFVAEKWVAQDRPRMIEEFKKLAAMRPYFAQPDLRVEAQNERIDRLLADPEPGRDGGWKDRGEDSPAKPDPFNH